MLYEYLQTCGKVNIVLIAGEDTICATLLTLPRGPFVCPLLEEI